MVRPRIKYIYGGVSKGLFSFVTNCKECASALVWSTWEAFGQGSVAELDFININSTFCIPQIKLLIPLFWNASAIHRTVELAE